MNRKRPGFDLAEMEVERCIQNFSFRESEAVSFPRKMAVK
jgi:hypothetical protein